VAAPISPMVRRRQLMAELRRLRDAAGLTQDDVADQLDWHSTKVMRIETGRTAPHPNDVRSMLGLYGVTSPEEATALVKLAQDARQRGRWYSYRDVPLNRYEFFVGLEAEASTIRSFELAVVPGLLQTEDYARAVILGGPMKLAADEVERRVEVRMTRQQALSQEARPQLWAILDEAAIRRTVGGPAVMRRQLESLAQAAQQVKTIIQIVPFGGGAHAGQLGPFVVLDFPESSEPEVVTMETVGGKLYVDKPEEVRLYNATFDHLRAVALSPGHSGALLRAAADALS
jgi:transcriptional regulator with XRE-family HTH domain